MAKNHSKPNPVGSAARGLIGAVGIVGLLDDITPLALYGQLKNWYDAYFGVLEKMRVSCFGWVEHLPLGLDRWFGITPLEAHLTVVLVLLMVSLQRAIFFSTIDDAFEDEEIPEWFKRLAFLMPVMFTTIAPLFALLLGLVMVLFPTWWTLPIYGFIIVVVTLVAYTPAGQVLEEEEGGPKPLEIRREINTVLTWAIILIALNYSVFRLV